MSDKILGYLTLKVPVHQATDDGGLYEPPEEYLYLGKAELVEHDIPERDLTWLAQEAMDGDLLMNFELPIQSLTDLGAEVEAKQEAEPVDLSGLSPRLSPSLSPSLGVFFTSLVTLPDGSTFQGRLVARHQLWVRPECPLQFGMRILVDGEPFDVVLTTRRIESCLHAEVRMVP